MKRTYIDLRDLSDHSDRVLLAADKGDLETWGKF